MKSKYTRPLIILVTIITIAICYIGFNEPIFMDSQEMRHPSVLLGSFGQTGYYKINPETILEALESGERNVFTPLVVTPIAPDYSTPFHWEQTDYITISNALQEFVWQENSANWSIHSMTFYGDCNYNPVGFDLLIFEI